MFPTTPKRAHGEEPNIFQDEPLFLVYVDNNISYSIGLHLDIILIIYLFCGSICTRIVD
jgi:hypothetical protein